MKKGVTLIELMIVVSIISFITISTLTGFMISSERLKFQNQLKTLESFISSHKAASFNDTTGQNNYTISINTSEITNTTTEIISTSATSNTYQIQSEDMVLLNFNARSTSSAWTSIPGETIEISIDSQERLCNITNNNQEYLILHIPIRKPDEIEPSKHLYIHRQNCLIESLNNQIQQT